MSTDYSNISGLGMIIDLSFLTTRILVDSCEHFERNGQKFCPVCGKRVLSRKETHNSISYDLYESLFDDHYTLPSNFVFTPLFGHENKFFIGFGVQLDSRGEEEWHIYSIPDKGEIEEVIQSVFCEMQAKVPDLPDDLLENFKIGFHSFNIWR